MLLHLNLNVQIACRRAMFAGLAFARQTDPVTGIHARRNFNRQGFGLFYAAMAMTFIARIFNQRTASSAVRTGLLYRKALTHLHRLRHDRSDRSAVCCWPWRRCRGRRRTLPASEYGSL